MHHGHVVLALLGLSTAACTFQWDNLDPRLTDGSGSESAGGGGIQGVGGVGATGGGATSIGGAGGEAMSSGGGGTGGSGIGGNGSGAEGGGGTGGGTPVCDEIFDQSTGHCYVMRTTGVFWSEALQDCQSLGQGWSLVGISAPEEMAFITAHPDIFPSVSGSAIWTGGTDAATEGVWVNVNGEEFNAAAWGSGEPNQDTPDEDCAPLRSDGALYDYLCNYNKPYLCEADYSSSP